MKSLLVHLYSTTNYYYIRFRLNEVIMENYDSGLGRYPVSSVIVTNLAMLLWIGSGVFAIWLLRPLAGIIFGIVGLVGVYTYLRWVVCRHCWYYGKRCSSGWGIISAAFFAKGDESRFNQRSLLVHIFSVYGFLMLAPMVVLIYLFMDSYAPIQIYALIAVFLFAFISGFILRIPGCTRCKQRAFCPGCASPLKQ